MGDESLGSAIIVRGIIGTVAEATHPPGILHVGAIVSMPRPLLPIVYVPIFINQRAMSRIVKL